MNKNDQQKIIQEGHENFIKKNYGAARTSWLKLLEIEPKNISLLKSISLTYYYENNLEDTENFLKKIVEINLSEPKALSMLVLVLEQQDKILEAKKFIKLGLSKKVLNPHWEILMKTMNPIESSLQGKITKIFVQNEEAVEFGQPLMLIE